MSQNVKEIQCVTATLKNELLCLQDDDTESVVAVARNEQHMIELIEKIDKFTPINPNDIQLNICSESEVFEFISNAEDIKGITFIMNGNIVAIDKKQVLEKGISPFLYYNTKEAPIFCAPTVLKDHFYLAFDGDALFTVSYENCERLLLIARTEEDMNELATILHEQAPRNFKDVTNLTCEQMEEEKILRIIQGVDGFLFINDTKEFAMCFSKYAISVGIQACFAAG